GPCRADRRADGLRRRDRLGHVEAERPAAAKARHLARGRALRLPRPDDAARGPRAHGRVVSVAAARTGGRALMASRALPARPAAPARAWAATRRAYAWVLSLPPLLVLSMLAVVQWLALVGLVLSIRHNGWLFYQGGDETFYYSGAWGIAGGHLPPGSVGYGWTLLLAPIALFAGASYLAALPALVLLQVVVLLPLGLFFMYGIGERIAGRWLGYVTAV